MKRLALLTVIFIATFAAAQKLPSDGFDKIRIAESDKTIQADLKAVTTAPEMQADRTYYWYSGNGIHATQGGFSGRLLNGDYKEYYLNKNLKELGQFKNGLKTGLWKSWNADGLLVQSCSWKNGMKAGVFYLYDGKGDVKQSGSYKANLLNGKVKSYDDGGNKLTITTYEDGKLVENKPSNSFSNKSGD